MEGEKKPREEEAGLDDVTIQESRGEPQQHGMAQLELDKPEKKSGCI
jgi:hypothetical protein